MQIDTASNTTIISWKFWTRTGRPRIGPTTQKAPKACASYLRLLEQLVRCVFSRYEVRYATPTDLNLLVRMVRPAAFS